MMSTVERTVLIALLVILVMAGAFALAAQAGDPARKCAVGMQQAEIGGHTICWMST